MAKPYWRCFRIVLLLVAVAVMGLLVYVAEAFWEDANFRAVEEGVLYRAAQMEGWGRDDWAEIFSKAPFASVINLRGAKPDKPWYAAEVAFAEEKGITRYDFALSADKEPDMPTMEALVEDMRHAPKPLLIHCKQGSDRTGLASALYAYAILGQSSDEAAKQLSLFYGHFPWLFSQTGAMDRAFAAYVQTHPR